MLTAAEIRLSRSRAAIGLAALLLICGCAAERERARTIAFEDCRLPKLATAARCGWVEVPEDRAAVNGRRIKLFVALLPANTLDPKPDPVLILAGGPGQSATSLAPFASRLYEIRRTRDVVLIDQRGTGRSAPLDCAALQPDDAVVEALETDFRPRVRACAEELAKKGIDVTQYTTAAWVADLEAARTALGYARWNLWGGSYGTRVALHYLRLHGERVRSMVLDGVASPSLAISLGVWASRERALDTLIDSCEATPSCQRAYPKLRATLDRLAHELGSQGREVKVVDPRTGESHAVTLTFDALLAGLHPLTYIPELAVTLPQIIARGAQGDWSPLYATAQMVTADLAEQTNIALHYAVTCAEDTPRVTRAERARLEQMRARALAERALAVCDAWPRSRQTVDAGTPVTSNVPTLLLSGGLDPVTPPAYAEEVAKSLSNSRHIVASGYGHIVSPHACGPRLIAAFFDRAGFDTLPASCLDHFAKSSRPPLWPNQLAPAQ